MLDRYSAEARRAVELAREESRRLGHPYVGTEHLLLGLLAEGDNAASRALQGAGASLALCREKVIEALASRSLTAPDDPTLELTDRASRALERAGRLSARLKSDEVETSHVLVSVLDVEGTAGQVLRGLSVDLGAVRDGLVQPGERSSVPDAAASTEAPDESIPLAEASGPEPLCPTCGAPLKASLGRSVITSADGADFDVAYCTTCGATLGLSRLAVTTSRAATASRTARSGPARDPEPPRPRRRRA
ncbi:MAG TPA: Clp protease N-terminal domain-containing protein [Acidimicrobiales bacterium]|nr:Clp protease N-terminal domain-containing protein [Acidimicrobiales bacterium]